MPFVPLLASICPTSPGCPRCLCSPLTSSGTFLIDPSVKKGKYTRNQLTQWPTLQFLCCDRKDHQHLCHNFNVYVRHCRSRCEGNVYLKPAKEMIDTIKDLDYLFLAGTRIFRRLSGSKCPGVKIVCTNDTWRILTRRRTPIPAKIAFAGGNA